MKYWVTGMIVVILMGPEQKPLKAQVTEERTISVFLDCRTFGCSESFIRDEIRFVNFVRNQEDADVHILINSQEAGSGGQEYTIQFFGGNSFEGNDHELKYFSPSSDTEDEQREGLNHYIKFGLFSYMGSRSIVNDLRISYTGEDEEETPDVQSTEDKWNYWVFEIGADTDLEGEESEKELSIEGQASAERITPEWKTQFWLEQNYESRSFVDDDTTRVFTTQIRSAELEVVKSLTNHWSAGGSAQVRSSTRDNTRLLANTGVAVEYSLFPYEEFTRRQITFTYILSGGQYNYEELTIYGKTEEFLLQHRIGTDIQFTQPWGELEAEINGYAYLHDFDKNRLDMELQFDFRIFRGFSIYVSGEYAWIYDQLSIPAGEITDEEQLLDLRQRFTSYSYEVRVGLEFQFGSIYNNVVNPRM